MGILTTILRYQLPLQGSYTLGNKLTYADLPLGPYAMRGNAQPQPARRLTTEHVTKKDKQPTESLGFWHDVKTTLFGIAWVCLGLAVAHMRPG